MTTTPDLATLAVRQRTMLDEQQRTWPMHLKGAAQGNPFATLCDHCKGRHTPPRDDLCPHANLDGKFARLALRNHLKDAR